MVDDLEFPPVLFSGMWLIIHPSSPRAAHVVHLHGVC
jgi:hypothetical protein